MNRIAAYQSRNTPNTVKCVLCPLNCVIQLDKTGVCGTRKNVNGQLQLLNYGQVSAINIDPIEKKPLYHFLPGSSVLSIGNKGCNLKCQFCQNWQISQTNVPTQFMDPERVLDLALNHKVPSVAFTYAEPVIWFEYILECAKLLKKHDIKVILVTNGMINREPFLELREYIDALNIDIKSMNPDFYKNLCGGLIGPILETCKLACETCHLEITNLVITDENDSEQDIAALAEFISCEIDPMTPLHLSRYHPSYNMKNPSTPVETVINAGRIASKYLSNIYLGNLPLEINNNTYCSKCNHLLIKREGYGISVTPGIESGICPDCGNPTGIPFS